MTQADPDTVWEAIKYAHEAIGCLINAGEQMEGRMTRLEKRIKFLETMLESNKFKPKNNDVP